MNNTIALDFDGVITDPHSLKSSELKRLGHDVPPEHTERFYCTRRCGVPMEAYEKAAYSANISKLLEVPTEEGAVDALNRLKRQNVRLVVVTSRYESETGGIQSYLTLNKISVDDIFHTDRKSKYDIVRSLSPILYVDDSPNKLIDLLPLKDVTSLFLFRNVANGYWRSEDSLHKWNEGRWVDIEAHLNRLFKQTTC